MHSRNFWPVLILKEEAMMFVKIHFHPGPKNREQDQQVQTQKCQCWSPSSHQKVNKAAKSMQKKNLFPLVFILRHQKWMWGLKINQKDAFERFLAFSKRVISNAQEKLAKVWVPSLKVPFMQTYSWGIFSEQTKNITHF